VGGVKLTVAETTLAVALTAVGASGAVGGAVVAFTAVLAAEQVLPRQAATA